MPDRRWRRRLSLVAAVCCAVGPGVVARAGASPTAVTEGSIGIQLLDAPVQRRADPRAHRYIVDHVPPGTGIRRQVLVINKSAQQRRVHVYPAAATIEQGQFRFASADTGNELTSWTEVDHPELDLAAWEQAVVEVTIAVPAKATEGERYAVIWAATSSQATAGATEPPRGPGKGAGAEPEVDEHPGDGVGAGDRPRPTASPDGVISQVRRVGVRVYLDVGMGGEPRSDFTIGELLPARADTGVPSLTVTVRNTGGRAIDLDGTVDLFDGPAGARAGPFRVTKGASLLPEESATVLFDLPADLPDGPWTVTVELRSGLVTREATGELIFPEPGAAGRPATVLSGMLTGPTMVGGSLVVGLLVLVGLAAVARRTRSGGWRR